LRELNCRSAGVSLRVASSNSALLPLLHVRWAKKWRDDSTGKTQLGSP
jgi:hypothetical protein